MPKIIDLEKEENLLPKAFLVGEPENNLYELESLISTLNMEIVGKLTLVRLEIKPAFGMGAGKAHEIVELAKESEADCIIFDFTLDPTKQRNWEKLAKIPCFDRQEVILRIFAERAQTREAVLQVELARLEYARPRLAHVYGDLARQRGGNYGSKGSGETQLELDQRQIKEKIQDLKIELKKVVKNRNVQRKRREKNMEPLVALAGYTNAGKSSLLNVLTKANVLAENKLFATLDPTTRKLFLDSDEITGKPHEILLSDTVGFISNLPHSLVDAFKSTLEEVKKANLILLILDSSDENIFAEYETCMKVLQEIGADENSVQIVLNKTDIMEENHTILTELEKHFPNSLKVSVKTGTGLEKLKTFLREKFFLIAE